LEAVVALAIVSITAVAALAALAAELRTADRVQRMLPAAALADDRLAVLKLLPPESLARLPDSVARGRFAPPFDAYRWTARARDIPGTPGLYDLTVVVAWDDGEYTLRSRVYRPLPRGVAP
ncbi:MAG TPA: hypothetical protein VF158_16400, partial [Longimicrobiales bacterium]